MGGGGYHLSSYSSHSVGRRVPPIVGLERRPLLKPMPPRGGAPPLKRGPFVDLGNLAGVKVNTAVLLSRMAALEQRIDIEGWWVGSQGGSEGVAWPSAFAG
jgi:hypothetical protein